MNHTPTEDRPSAKARRISRACETCRARKDKVSNFQTFLISKCDGLLPCGNCKSNNRQCLYSESSRKRFEPPFCCVDRVQRAPTGLCKVSRTSTTFLRVYYMPGFIGITQYCQRV